ncbi:MAG: heme a synthase [Solirubrobacteraceae bacterium]|nr:heme a synthase [Solirubrobacteraceae bacterium]
MALAALIVLTLIVLTGAIVRLSGSGLGCPDWPKCFGKTLPPLKVPALIEYGNRVITGLVTLVVVATAVLAFLRRPFRRDLATLAALLPLGVVAQIVLGGFTVREHLRPGYVMAHFSLSMIILVAAVALAWRARREPRSATPSADRGLVWAVRSLVPLGALTIFVGTAASGAGPHPGGAADEKVHRLYFKGVDTLNYVVHRHAGIATLLGLAALGVWILARRRGAEPEVRRALTAVVVLMAVQGVLGAAQFALELPAEMVWAHVLTAALTWLSILWAVAAAGRLSPARAGAPADAFTPQTASGR